MPAKRKRTATAKSWGAVSLDMSLVLAIAMRGIGNAMAEMCAEECEFNAHDDELRRSFKVVVRSARYRSPRRITRD